MQSTCLERVLIETYDTLNLIFTQSTGVACSDKRDLWPHSYPATFIAC